MGYLSVRGKKRLEGTLKIQGSKNSCLPMIAAALLTDEQITLKNCPDIADVREMIKILEYLGCTCEFRDNVLIINCRNAVEKQLPPECGKLRASIVYMGAMLARFGRVIMPYPGGCNLGKRPIDYHLDGTKKLGGVVAEDGTMLLAAFDSTRDYVKYIFPGKSLGALENLLLLAVASEGITEFDNCTREPEIVDFCDFLIAMGADISGVGSNRIIVRGGKKLHGTFFEIPGDRIVAGTYLSAVAVTGGNIRLTGIKPDRLTKLIFHLRKIGCHIFTDSKTNEIIGMSDNRCKSFVPVITGPYPELATDLQPQLMSVACYSTGISKIQDVIYPDRYGIAESLRSMGADIVIENNCACVTGVESLCGTTVTAPDLRGGAALVIAALGARKITCINGYAYIQRGYEDIIRDLRCLGADIEWKEDTETDVRNGE